MVPIQIENLHFTYPSRETPTLQGISTHVAPGDFVLLTGPTGCGKSTLLRTMNGLIPHASAGTFSGTVRINGTAVASQPLAVTCRHVSLLFQNPEQQLFCTQVEDEIAFGLENLSLPPAEIEKRIAAALKQVGLPEFRTRRTRTLSGGEKQRVALAAICAMQPQVLLLDEPTSYLDSQATQDILNIVSQRNAEMGIIVIWATHQIKEVAPLCNRVWLMHDGQLSLDLPKAEAFRDPTPYRRLGVQPPYEDVPELCYGTRSVPTTTTIVQPPYEDTERQIDVPTPRRSSPAGPLIHLRSLSFKYPNSDKAAVNSVSSTVTRGEVIAVMGANGSGKTTLLHLMAGLLRPAAGEIVIAGKTLKRAKLHQLAGKVGIVFQNADLVLQAETVRDEVEFGPKNLKLPPETRQKRVADTLALFALAAFAEETPYSLSRGQRQRVAVAANVSLHPDLLLLDEPTTGQDAQHLNLLMGELCNKIKQENKSLIFTTHNLQLTLKYADRVLLLRDGELVFDSTPDTGFADMAL